VRRVLPQRDCELGEQCEQIQLSLINSRKKLASHLHLHRERGERGRERKREKERGRDRKREEERERERN
jgi:hypothetical protein